MQLSFCQCFVSHAPQTTINPGRSQLLKPLNSAISQQRNSIAKESHIYGSELQRFNLDRIQINSSFHTNGNIPHYLRVYAAALGTSFQQFQQQTHITKQSQVAQQQEKGRLKYSLKVFCLRLQICSYKSLRGLQNLHLFILGIIKLHNVLVKSFLCLDC